MKKVMVLFVLILNVVNLFAQTISVRHFTFDGTEEVLQINIKSFDYSEDASMPQMIDEIMSLQALNKNFRIKADYKCGNAAAVIILNERYLLYNPNWIKDVKNKSGSNWTIYSILAHEIGHHLNGHTLDETGSTPPKELEADEFSGFILYKLGATLYEAQLCMNLVSSDEGSTTHPPKIQRLRSIKMGWEKAQKLGVGTTRPDSPSGLLIDKRDDKKYKTTKIGTQTWMAENLAFKPDFGNFWSYENNPNYIQEYGYLYDWKISVDVCPDGWRLPTKNEFETLLKNTGGLNNSFNQLIVGGISGFDAKFSGFKGPANFFYLGSTTSFWSSSISITYFDPNFNINITEISALDIKNYSSMKGAFIWPHISSQGLSVRCIKKQ